MLMKHGLYSAIVDAFDTDLIQIAKGERPDIVKVVHDIMDGQMPDYATLTEEQIKYAKSTKVLMGESLYSHSWLDI